MPAMASKSATSQDSRGSSNEVEVMSRRLFTWAYYERKTNIQVARNISTYLNKDFFLNLPMPWPNHF